MIDIHLTKTEFDMLMTTDNAGRICCFIRHELHPGLSGDMMIGLNDFEKNELRAGREVCGQNVVLKP